MNIVRYPTDRLVSLLDVQKVATMPQLKSALGTAVTLTVLRKLSPLGYRSSYSHCGTYYTLDSIAQYDELGLWCYRDIHFSQHGTLLNTAEVLVTQSPAGYWAGELEAVVHVVAKDALRQLVQAGRLHRESYHGLYLYLARDRSRRQEQWAARQAQEPGLDSRQEEFRAARVLFYSLLDEQQRRLYAGLESFKQGHGGDRQLAQALGLDEDTVARGRRELLAREVQPDRVRRAGGGRPRAEKKRPTS